jgi:Rrf2 family transcriptional regulator, nitric oxide-sensitive transcriptional repressor
MFSTTTEYALRSMVLLAMRRGSSQTAQQIAAETKVPIDYLFKVLNSLSRARLVQAQRGKGGGFSLVSDPADISILDVVQAVDPIKRIATCPLGLKAHGIRLCPLHHKLDDAMRHIEEAFSSTKLADLIDESSPIRPLCAGQILSANEVKPLPDVRTHHAKPF